MLSEPVLLHLRPDAHRYSIIICFFEDAILATLIWGFLHETSVSVLPLDAGLFITFWLTEQQL